MPNIHLRPLPVAGAQSDRQTALRPRLQRVHVATQHPAGPRKTLKGLSSLYLGAPSQLGQRGAAKLRVRVQSAKPARPGGGAAALSPLCLDREGLLAQLQQRGPYTQASTGLARTNIRVKSGVLISKMQPQ